MEFVSTYMFPFHISIILIPIEKVHTMGAPLAHTSKAFAPAAWQTFSSVGPLNRANVRILNGRATGIDPAAKMATYSTGKTEECVEYDYLVASTGSKRSWPIVPKALDKISYLKDAETHISSLENASSVVVVGGGESPFINPPRLSKALEEIIDTKKERLALRSPPN